MFSNSLFRFSRQHYVSGLLAMACLVLLAVPFGAFAQDDAEPLPSFDELEPGMWTQLVPGGDAICMYDTEYSFFVRPAEEPTDKLLVYFQGGGACWDGFTCGAIGQFASNFDVTDDEMAVYTEGMFDFDNPANPVADYNIVFVPYCSGDVHIGSSSVTFDVPAEELGVDFDEISVQFNGYTNSATVLDWTYRNFLTPDEVLVTGCSAGGYGATYHAPYIMQHYDLIPSVLLADAAIGVTPRAWEGYNTWDVFANLPEFMPGLAALTIDTYNNTATISELMNAFPQNTFAQYSTFLDQVQVSFYGLQIGVPINEETFPQVAGEWSLGLIENRLRLENNGDNYAAYVAGGLSHCIINTPDFYEFAVEGVLFSDWVADVLDHNRADYTCNFEIGQCNSSPVAAG